MKTIRDGIWSNVYACRYAEILSSAVDTDDLRGRAHRSAEWFADENLAQRRKAESVSSVESGESPLVVLDIDGVVSGKSLWKSLEIHKGYTVASDWIDRACVRIVDAICRATGAAIVISSSWRTYETIQGQSEGLLAGTVATLRSCGLEAPVVGATPDHATQAMKIAAERAPRWPEIRAYLESVTSRPYVVIDDSEIDGVPPSRFVRTDIEVGITWSNADAAIDILRRGPSLIQCHRCGLPAHGTRPVPSEGCRTPSCFACAKGTTFEAFVR